MMPFDLSRWFRRRMLPLVIAVSLTMLAGAPLSYHLAKGRELFNEARGDAGRVAVVLRGEIEQRPLLWRYDMPKLAERLSEEGLLGAARLVIRDGDGADVPIDLRGLPGRRPEAQAPIVWGRAEVYAGGERAASVWVAVDATPLWRGTGWLAAAFALLAAALGAVLYLLPTRAITAAERRIAALLAHLAVTLQEEDRRRIARDLHDGAGQALTAARLRLMAIEKRLPPEPATGAGAGGGDGPGGGAPGGAAAMGAALREVGRLLDEATGEVRRSAYALTPPALSELGLSGALGRHCDAFAAATGLEVRCVVDEALGGLPAPVETACYRIVQEALSNCVRHAGARRAQVELQRQGGELRLTIQDDGGSAAAQRRASGVEAGEGLGLLGIRERAQLLGGAAEITAPPGQGLRIEVRLPT